MASGTVGAKAPTYTAGELKWLKGEPINIPAHGKPTVIELWAAWVGQELMQLAQVSGIPHAMVVDSNGLIQYSGHPMEPNFLATIEKVTSEAKPATRMQELPPITASREELMAKPVRELKKALQDRSISLTGLSEKVDLVDKILDACSNVTFYKEVPAA